MLRKSLKNIQKNDLFCCTHVFLNDVALKQNFIEKENNGASFFKVLFIILHNIIPKQ